MVRKPTLLIRPVGGTQPGVVALSDGWPHALWFPHSHWLWMFPVASSGCSQWPLLVVVHRDRRVCPTWPVDGVVPRAFGWFFRAAFRRSTWPHYLWLSSGTVVAPRGLLVRCPARPGMVDASHDQVGPRGLWVCSPVRSWGVPRARGLSLEAISCLCPSGLWLPGDFIF